MARTARKVARMASLGFGRGEAKDKVLEAMRNLLKMMNDFACSFAVSGAILIPGVLLSKTSQNFATVSPPLLSVNMLVSVLCEQRYGIYLLSYVPLKRTHLCR